MSWGRQLQRAQDAGYQSLWFDGELDGRFRVVLDDRSTVRPRLTRAAPAMVPLPVPLGIDVELDDPNLVTGPRLASRRTAAHEGMGRSVPRTRSGVAPGARAYFKAVFLSPICTWPISGSLRSAGRQLQVAAVLKCIGNLLEVDVVHQLIDMDRDGSGQRTVGPGYRRVGDQCSRVGLSPERRWVTQQA